MQTTIQFDLSDNRQIRALQAMLDSLAGERPAGKRRYRYRVVGTTRDGVSILQPKLKPTRKSRKGKPWSKADVAYLRAHYDSMTARQLAEKLKRENPQSIYQAARQFKISRPHLRVVA